MNSRRRTSRAGSASLRRRGPVRSVRERIIIVCEGSKTEPAYLRYVHSTAASLIVELVIVDEPATSPKQLVERAVSIKRDSDRELRRTRDPNAVAEHIWCVFDVDEHLFIREACAHAAAMISTWRYRTLVSSYGSCCTSRRRPRISAEPMSSSN